jgi:sterol desaturase/sphingolipid hydroxylase (fatty acid hydroxylase superfamily)
MLKLAQNSTFLAKPAKNHSKNNIQYVSLLFFISQWLGSCDYFHYLHQKHFDCNYSGPQIPLDKLFGTFASCKLIMPNYVSF